MNYNFTKNNKTIAIALMAIGLVAIVIGFNSDPHRTWSSLLVNNFYFLAIGLAGTFFIAFNTVAQSGWWVVIKRVPEAMGAQILPSGILMILIFFLGKHDLYHWTHEGITDPTSHHYDPIIAGKSGYLNVPFFVIRMFAYVGIWTIFTYLLRKESLKMDVANNNAPWQKSIKLGAAFLVLFAITSSTSAWDFLMSVETHWFSTLFGWYTFAGLFITGLTTMALLVVYLKSQGYLEYVNENHIHDLGKYMFAFSVFWTYLWFVQFMLIWYSNLPEEVTFYINRMENYRGLFIANFLINFCVPFLLFMTRDAKRKRKLLVFGGIIMLIGHWIDFFMIVIPGAQGTHGQIGFIEIGIFLGIAGLFLFMFFRSLSKAPVTPQKHPMLEESIHFHV